MGTGTIESHYLLLFLAVQHMPTGAGGGGKGRPSSPGKKIRRAVIIINN